MEQALSYVSSFFLSLQGVAAFVLLCVGIYWQFNKKAKQKQLAELRAKLDTMQSSDPEYGQVRALYTSMMIEMPTGGTSFTARMPAAVAFPIIPMADRIRAAIIPAVAAMAVSNGHSFDSSICFSYTKMPRINIFVTR